MQHLQDQPASSSYTHPTEVHSVCACLNDDALDLLAVGGENSVEVLQRDFSTSTPRFEVIASFYVATTVRAIAWSPRTVSPSVSENWFLELVVAGADNNLRLLLRSPAEDGDEDEPETEVRMFGGGLSGHHKRINDVCFCTSETYQTHVASIGDDGLIMWNLYPKSLLTDTGVGDITASTDRGTNHPMTIEDSGHDTEEEVEQSLDLDYKSRSASRKRRSVSMRQTGSEPTIEAPQPTAYIIRFPHPLHSISSHPSSANQFMVSDSHGKVYIIDWTKLDPDSKPVAWRGHRVVELVDPRALTDGLTGGKGRWTGGAYNFATILPFMSDNFRLALSLFRC